MKNIKLINGYPYTRYSRDLYSMDEMTGRSASFAAWMDKRRTCRDFSDRPVPREIIEDIHADTSADSDIDIKLKNEGLKNISLTRIAELIMGSHVFPSLS